MYRRNSGGVKQYNTIYSGGIADTAVYCTDIATVAQLVVERNWRWEEPREQIQANAIAARKQRFFDASCGKETARLTWSEPRRL